MAPITFENTYDPAVQRIVEELNATCVKSGFQADVKRLMTESFLHRQSLRADNSQSILLVYKKFKEIDFLVRNTSPNFPRLI